MNELAVKADLKLNSITALFIVMFHLGAFVALFCYSSKMLILALIVWTIGCGPGIGVGFHRLLTHLGFKTYKPVEYFLTLLGCLTLEGSPLWWVAVHRKHHRYTEQVGRDPHTPRDGKFWSHMGWILLKDFSVSETEFLKLYVPDLLKDPVHVWISRYCWLPLMFLGATLFLYGGYTWVLWGAVVPVVLSWHGTWLVNSATHLWGSRMFNTPDDSRNNWWVAMLSFGEGWHNNHHARPVLARHGIVWYQFDPNWYFIRTLKFCGLAWDIKEP